MKGMMFHSSRLWHSIANKRVGPLIVSPRFGSSGPSALRIESLIAKPCCRCHRKHCYSKLARIKPSLLEFLRVFWGLKKHIQDEYIRQTVAKSKVWHLLGQRMGGKCVIAAIGLSNSRFHRVNQGQVDRRYKVWGFVSWHWINWKFVFWI